MIPTYAYQIMADERAKQRAQLFAQAHVRRIE